MNAPAGKSELVSLELVEFNSSVTLSQQYTVLGKVAKEVGKVYEKSGDETLAQLAQGYYIMEEEAKISFQAFGETTSGIQQRNPQ